MNLRKTLCVTILALFATKALYAASYKVERGDTLFSVLGDAFSPQEIMTIDKEIKSYVPGFILRTGTSVYRKGDDELVLKFSKDKEFNISRHDDHVDVSLQVYEKSSLRTVVSGTIDTTLFQAVAESGEDAELAARIVQIFEWEIDFYKDLRPGDSYRVYLEKKFYDTGFAGYGKIIAAEFVSRGKLHRAYYYENDDISGYFDEEGRSLQRSFLRAPVKYGRVSSRFTDSRMHPILKKRMAHPAVDYAVPMGTPIMATAAGVVTARRYDKAAGNYIKLRHSNGYETLYLHMSKFNKNAKLNSRVKQGDIIGYAGMTGYATGPHVDYRIKKDGKYLDPLKFYAPVIKLDEENLATFANTISYAKSILNRGGYEQYVHIAIW